MSSVRAALTGATWIYAKPMHIPRQAHTATLLPNGKVLVVGGETTGSQRTALTEIYDPATDEWTDAEPLAVARYNHTATLLPNGKVLVAGGYPSCAPLPPDPDDPEPPDLRPLGAELYDPATGHWSSAGDLNAYRDSHSAIGLPDGRVVVAGGQDCAGDLLDSVEVYGSTESPNGWVTLNALHSARFGAAITQLKDGRILIAGGGGIAYGTTPVDDNAVSAELYDPAHDPATEAWIPTAHPMNYWARAGATAELLSNGKVLVVGVSGAGTQPDQVTPLVYGAELYDPTTDGWSNTGNTMTVARQAPGVVVTPTGDILVVGGAGPNPPFFTLPTPPPAFPTVTELYSVGADSWSPAGDLVEGVQSGAVTAFTNGKVLVTGGSTYIDTDLVAKAQITSKLAQGSACQADTDCATSACADGVCCDVACGTSTTDCQACSVAAGAAVNGTCGAVQLTAAIVCRPPAGACDAPEVCLGTSQDCPPDLAVAAGTTCGAANGDCSLAAQCVGDVGATALCASQFVKSGTECRKAAGPCDIAETCTGIDAACPTDAFFTATTVCRPAASVCDQSEKCDGVTAQCPRDEAIAGCGEAGDAGATGTTDSGGSANGGSANGGSAGSGTSTGGTSSTVGEAGDTAEPPPSAGSGGKTSSTASAGAAGEETQPTQPSKSDDGCSCRLVGTTSPNSAGNYSALLGLGLGLAAGATRRRRRPRAR